MRILLVSLAAAGLALSAGAVQAQSSAAINTDQSFTGVDTDRNGNVSWAEFSLVFPDVTEEQFNQADANGDTYLSQDEFDNLQLSTGSIGQMAPAPAPVEPVAPGSSLTYTEPD